jgi:hypothetical protein
MARQSSGGRTRNPRILGPLLSLAVDGGGYLRVLQLRMLIVCGQMVFDGAV